MQVIIVFTFWNDVFHGWMTTWNVVYVVCVLDINQPLVNKPGNVHRSLQVTEIGQHRSATTLGQLPRRTHWTITWHGPGPGLSAWQGETMVSDRLIRLHWWPLWAAFAVNSVSSLWSSNLRCLRVQPTVVLPAKRQLCRSVKPWLNQQSDHHYVCYSHRTITMHVTAIGPSLCMLQP